MSIEAESDAGVMSEIAAELRKHLGFLLDLTRYEDHANGVVVQGMDEGDVVSSRIIADADEVADRYDSFISSRRTGENR